MTHATLAASQIPRERARAVARQRPSLLILWLVSGAMLLAFLDTIPVTRTQEARVLETAREMLGAPARQWLIPHVNGRLRMQKPPLAYWLSAWSYELFGVSEAAGRLPAVLAAWLTLGVTGAASAKLFGRRAALFAGGALLSSFLFLRYGRLGETDVLVTVFVTAATWAMWRGARSSASPATSAGWFHAAASAMALAALSKGPAAAYPLLFLIFLCIAERRWRPLWRFVASGAVVTFLILAAPWFVYVANDRAAAALVQDLRNSAYGGKGHWDWPTVYVGHLALAVAPWTGVVAVALFAAFRRWRTDERLRGLLIWMAVILVPLCLWGNKQRHYLLPLLPPLMILAGWFADRGLRAEAGTWAARTLRGVLVGTFVAGLALIPVVLVVGVMVRGSIATLDVVLLAVAMVTAAVTVDVFRQRGAAPALTIFGAGIAVVMFVAVALWEPSLEAVNSRSIASVIRARYGDSVPLVFVHREFLPLCFNLRQQIPIARNEAQLASLAKQHSELIAIELLSEEGRSHGAIVAGELRFEVPDEGTFIIGRPRASIEVQTNAPDAPR